MRNPCTALSAGRGLVLAACTVACAAAACGWTPFTPHPDPSRFFVLTPLSGVPVVDAARLPALGVGPVSFPHYLDRPEIVTRVSSNEVKPAAFDYWAGSLPRQFVGVLAQNLQMLLGVDRMEIHPWYAASAPPLIVEADVQRFEPSASGEVQLVVIWRIRKGSRSEVLRSGESSLSHRSAGPDAGSAAEALSGLLGEFSRELAQAIHAVQP